MAFSVDIKGIESLPDPNFNRARARFLDKIGAEAKKQARRTAPRASGDLRRAIDYKPDGTKAVKIFVHPAVWYAHFTEGGTRAHVVQPKRKRSMVINGKHVRGPVVVSGTAAQHYLKRAAKDPRTHKAIILREIEKEMR